MTCFLNNLHGQKPNNVKKKKTLQQMAAKLFDDYYLWLNIKMKMADN